MTTIKKILSVSAIIAVCAFAVSAPYVRAESENEHEDAKITTVSSSREGENESGKSHVKTKTKAKKAKKTKKTKKHVTSVKTGTTTPAVTVPAVSSGTSYSMAQVAAANSKTKCWTTIGGNVYDLTSWIAQHPGGQGAILGICGKDGTAVFDAQHGGQSRPEQELKSFLIGTLK